MHYLKNSGSCRAPGHERARQVCPSRHLPAEQVKKLDEQDEHYEDFKKEAARLVELVDHVVVKILAVFNFCATRSL